MAKVLKSSELVTPMGMYSHGMTAPSGEIVVVAGQVGVDRQGRLAGAEVGPQTKQALDNIRAVLAAAGCGMGEVVRLQTFLVRAEDIPGFMKAREEVFPGYFPDDAFPPNTLVVVSRLARPEFLVEIEAMAVRRARRAAPPKRAKRRPARGRR